MIELICREVHIGAAANIGGPPETKYVRFQIDHDNLESWLKGGEQQWSRREIVGCIESTEIAGRQ